MSILWLGEPDSDNPSMVGGKVAHLSVLAESYRVPPGFAVTAEAFDQAMSGRFPQDSTADQGHLIPESLYDRIVSSYRALSELCRQDQLSVAVRSSALDEDGVSASFAGQHDTFLNVVGEHAVAKSIADCWRSVYSPHAMEYRRRLGLPLDNMKMATLVQQLVPAEVSSVVFGANPITGNREEIAINASWGLGESIVAGTVTPDTFIIRKADMEIVTAEIGEKASMTVPVPGGTEEIDVPMELQWQPSITNEQAIEMARLAVELEAKMGWPVDIECAYYQGNLYLLQCRPITTLG
ncbi:MAG: PEP/pyruvate-binding domain-containing protein [Chloroflexi bacterium]|nr:PEP/pyruvate-binding domain-containing protein [Chloroflexota bacterium]